MRKREDVIKDIRRLIKSSGYIYALCMILFEDFHIDPEKIHEIDHRNRLNVKEATLLLGFLVQDKLDFSLPKTPEDLIQMKHKTYELMEELHQSFMGLFIEKMKKQLGEKKEKGNLRADMKDFFGKGDMLVEPIFYSGTGVYDFQYLEFLARKYKYDTKWLQEEKKFDISKAQEIVIKIKDVLQKKSKKVRLYNLKERLPGIVDDMKKKNPGEDLERQAKELLPMMELHQYSDLFFDIEEGKKCSSMDEVREEGWKSFYKNLIELFVVEKSDFNDELDIGVFLDNFSATPEGGSNPQFKTIGNYNIINSHPIIKLDEERYFVPITFLLPQAIYESPFYWMMANKDYRDQAGKNRGKVGEEIAYDFLAKVFGARRVFKSVKVSTKKGQDDTDIDVLCILGSKALCVQVKSKPLTLLARQGNDEKLQEDFQGAVQDAYDQGLISRQKILERGAKFTGEDGKEIVLSEEIDDAYIMCVTTENYPSLAHQAHIILDKNEEDPYPIALTVFDLELITHYLNDPYDLLYYIRQRILLMDFFKADEEMAFLGYHLRQKLWKIPKVDGYMIDTSFAQSIDRNYFPFKAGLEVTDDGDVIKQRWKNKKFEQLCDELKNLNEPKITDILFHLFDWSGDARETLVDLIATTKQKTLDDEKNHNFSLPPDEADPNRMGVTYCSMNSNNTEELRKRLLTLCLVRKYKSKGDIWLGFGSIKDSENMIDTVAFNEQDWEYDAELEKASKILLEGKGQGQFIRTRKIGRNEKCPCGSRLKYKRCCGKNE